MSNHLLKTLVNVTSPRYSVNSQSCLSLCQTPRNLNDRVGCSKGQDLCSSTDGKLINKALESLCWYSPGLGQRSRPMKLWQPLSSLKLLKCGVGWEERKESRLTWNLGCVTRLLGTWILKRVNSAMPGKCKEPCYLVLLQHSSGIKGSPRNGAQVWCCACLSVAKGQPGQGSVTCAPGTPHWNRLLLALLKSAEEIKTGFRGLRSGPKLEAMWKHWLDKLLTFKPDIFSQ